MNNRESESGKSKYFPEEQSPASAIPSEQNDCDDAATLEYDLKGDTDVKETPSYTDGDFCSGSEEDEMEEGEGHSSSASASVSESRKKTLRQTTLDSHFGRGTGVNKFEEKFRNPKRVKRWNDADTENYRKGYPGQKDDLSLVDNLDFYTGRIPSSPDGDYIDTIHGDWFGNYRFLERHHGYIQWLFPIREMGMNWQAQALQLHEAKAIQANRRAKKRVLTSFKLMLDFFGMKLDDEEKGLFSRSKNWKQQYDNLNWSSHNYLRITRILKSLGELGYEHLKKPFLIFLLEEALLHRTLPNILKSCRDYWIGTIKNDEDREELYRFIEDAD